MEIGAKLRSVALGCGQRQQSCVKEPMMEGAKRFMGRARDPSRNRGRSHTHTHLLRRTVHRRGLMEGTETATEGINKGVKYGDRRKLGVKIKAEEAEGWRTG